MDADPAELFLPAHRLDGPDLFKYLEQVRRHGTSIAGIGPIVVRRADNGLEIVDGVTRAARVAKLLPGTRVPVRIEASFPGHRFRCRRVRDVLGQLPDP